MEECGGIGPKEGYRKGGGTRKRETVKGEGEGKGRWISGKGKKKDERHFNHSLSPFSLSSSSFLSFFPLSP